MATPGQIQEVAKHYIIAAIWADCPEGTHPRETKSAERIAYQRAERFIAANRALFEAACKCEGYGSHPDAGSPEAAFGHDLYLTTARHGVGFWDRTELPKRLGEMLTQACREFGEPNPEFYRGWLYFNEAA